MMRELPAEDQHSPRVRRKRRHARQEILQAARQILRERGIDAVTLESVGGALGMTRQALYHYFPSKEALVRRFVASLIEDEVETLVAAVEATAPVEVTLGTLIRAFYNHYINNLAEFRAVYCQLQLYTSPEAAMDQETIRQQVNPQTQYLFDRLEARLAARSTVPPERLRRLAFVAWTSALGLITMIGVADALNDPLIHADKDLLDTLAEVFERSSA